MSDSYRSFRIEAHPRMHTVAVGTTVTYEVIDLPYEGYSDTSGGPSLDDISVDWYIIYDSTVKPKVLKIEPEGGSFDELGRKQNLELKVKWTDRGQHLVYCLYQYHSRQYLDGQNEPRIEYTQHVDALNIVQRKALECYKGEPLPNPAVERFNAIQYRNTLKAAAKYRPPPTGDAKAAHIDMVSQLDKYIEQLKKLMNTPAFSSDDAASFTPFYAIHYAKGATKQDDLQTRLRVCLRRVPLKANSYEIIDWTNPLPQSGMPKLAGIYPGKGGGDNKAIGNAMEGWRQNNTYYPGRIDMDILGTRWYSARFWGFETPVDDDVWSHLPATSKWLEYAGTAAGVLAVGAFILIPGGQVAGGLIWTAILTSTSSAVINIGRRHANGFADASMEDAFDILTILGNIFMAGQAGWVRGAVLTRGALKFVVYGDIAVTGFEGLLIGALFYTEFETILNDPKLTPSERIEKLGKWAAKAIGVGMLSYTNIKSNTTDIKALKGKVDQKLIDKFRNPNEEISLDQNPKIKADSADGKVKVTVRQDPERLGRPKTRVATEANMPSLPPSKRGMRNRDDAAFASMAEKGDIIIVRNSNPAALDYIGKKGYKAKPLELKAKTRQEPPNQGLAAADPEDPRVIETLKEKGIDYDTYVKQLEAEGYHVGGAKDGHLISDGAGNKFYSDYDLHGIYNGKTGRNSYSEAKRKALNRKFGDDLIQHDPHDLWPDRNNRDIAGVNYGPQRSCTVYMPNGKVYNLSEIDDMKAFYKEHNIAWDEIYPNH